jgi:hypothetical protein
MLVEELRHVTRDTHSAAKDLCAVAEVFHAAAEEAKNVLEEAKQE